MWEELGCGLTRNHEDLGSGDGKGADVLPSARDVLPSPRQAPPTSLQCTNPRRCVGNPSAALSIHIRGNLLSPFTDGAAFTEK